MKTVILLSLLLVAVPVGAEERTFKESDVRAAVKSFAQKVAAETRHDRDCLARMEEAMRAMEPFLLSQPLGSITAKWTNDEHKQWVDALYKWDDVKRDCWSQP